MLMLCALGGGPASAGVLPPPATADSSSVLVAGQGYAFFVDVPPGWRQDCGTLYEAGICALFYRPGETFVDAPVVLYVNPSDRKAPSLEQAVADDIEHLREFSPALRVRAQAPLETGDHRSVAVWRFEGSGGPTTTELVGYLQEPRGVVLFVASGKNAADLDREHPAFEQLVRSYAHSTVVAHQAD
jgi:hypothetical protein